MNSSLKRNGDPRDQRVINSLDGRLLQFVYIFIQKSSKNYLMVNIEGSKQRTLFQFTLWPQKWRQANSHIEKKVSTLFTNTVCIIIHIVRQWLITLLVLPRLKARIINFPICFCSFYNILLNQSYSQFKSKIIYDKFKIIVVMFKIQQFYSINIKHRYY